MIAMRNFEFPTMKISVFTEEVLTTESTTPVQPQQLEAIDAFNENGDSLVGRASFQNLMGVNK